jgi:hypothetical protein
MVCMSLVPRSGWRPWTMFGAVMAPPGVRDNRAILADPTIRGAQVRWHGS